MKARKPHPSATRRLEIDTGWASLRFSILTAKQCGELVLLLMQEVEGHDVHPPAEPVLLEAWNDRRDYSRIRGSFGRRTLAMPIRQMVFERDGRRCRYCGTEISWADYNCDHVFPVAKGGSDAAENLACSCRPCNLGKHAKTLDEWVAG